MIEFHLSVDALGKTRFAYSPLAEVASSLRLLGRVSDLIFDYWEVAIAPYWQRIRSVLDDDVAYRGAKAISDGIFSMFTDLHPEITLVDRVRGGQPQPHTELSDAQREYFDELVALSQEPDAAFDGLQNRYATDELVRVPETVFNSVLQRREQFVLAPTLR